MFVIKDVQNVSNQSQDLSQLQEDEKFLLSANFYEKVKYQNVPLLRDNKLCIMYNNYVRKTPTS